MNTQPRPGDRPDAMNREQARLLHNAIRARVAPGSMSLLVSKLLDLHSPRPIDGYDKPGPQFCLACPAHGDEYQSYPCTTTTAVADQVGIEVRGAEFVVVGLGGPVGGQAHPTPSSDTVTLSRADYDELREKAALLDALHSEGVYEWHSYEVAVDAARGGGDRG